MQNIMSATKRTSTALALLLPTGVIGISYALAVARISAKTDRDSHGSVAERLSGIRQGVSAVLREPADTPLTDANGPKLTLAEWLNFGGGLGWHNGGWHNGGWGNGGWHNGGWGNGGWHNGGWGNGGWHNGGWGNGGWHNGWHNYWHNW